MATAIAGTLCLALWLTIAWGPAWVAVVGRHPLSVAILMAFQSALLTSRGRKKWTDFYSQSWLSTLPLERRIVTRMILLRTCWLPAAVLIGVIAVLLLAEGFASSAGGAGVANVAICAIGTAAGLLLGWWLPQRDSDTPVPQSNQMRSVPGHTLAFTAISAWPLVQAKVWLKPRSIARLMILSLGLPMDVSGNVAVAVLWSLIVGLYLVVLLRATVEVAGRAGDWLRPTPISFARFAWSVVRFSLFKQILWTGLAAGVVVAMGANPLEALSIAELWLATVVVVSSIALAHAYRAREMHLKIWIAVCILTAIETLKHHVAFPCALAFSGWQLNRAARS